MHQNQRVHAALGDQPGGHHRFAEGRGRGKNACIVLQQRRSRHLLFRPQGAAKRNLQRNPAEPLIAKHGFDFKRLQAWP